MRVFWCDTHYNFSIRWSLWALLSWAVWYVSHITLFAKCAFWQLQHFDIMWLHDCCFLHVSSEHLCFHVRWFRLQNKHLDDLLHLFCKCLNVWHLWHWSLDQYSRYLIIWYVNLVVKTHFFRCFYASTLILNVNIIEAWFFLALFSSFDNHIELIISFNSELYFFSLILRYFILIFMLKILIFRLCITILYHFSFFLILLTSNICFHISLCFSKAFAMYFSKIIRTILLSFCVLVTVVTIMSDFAFFSAFFNFFSFFIKCMQSMTMTLSRRYMYARLHVTWSKSLLYIFSLINHIDSLRIQALFLNSRHRTFVFLCFFALFAFYSFVSNSHFLVAIRVFFKYSSVAILSILMMNSVNIVSVFLSWYYFLSFICSAL